MISYLPHRRQAFQPAGGGGTTVYVEHDFTATTSGTLATVSPDIDELGGGWLRHNTDYVFQASNTGVKNTSTTQNRVALLQTSGREDVQQKATIVLSRGSDDTAWQGLLIRGISDAGNGGLTAFFSGSATDPNIELYDGTNIGTALNTWDLSVLMTTPPDDGDTVDLVMRCSGDDIILYSIAVNGASAEVINSSYTLTGASKTAHGAGTGADYYGIASDIAGAAERFEYFKVESIPT